MSCDKRFGEPGDMLLTCEFCGNHRCISCLGMTKLVYKSISGRTDLPWFCNCCIVKSMESVKTTKSIEDRYKEFFVVFQKNVESRFDCLEGSMENVKSSLQTMKNEIVEVKNLVQTGIRETTLGLGESSSIGRSDPVCTETVVKQATFELQSRLDRKNNIVCYNVAR